MFGLSFVVQPVNVGCFGRHNNVQRACSRCCDGAELVTRLGSRLSSVSLGIHAVMQPRNRAGDARCVSDRRSTRSMPKGFQAPNGFEAGLDTPPKYNRTLPTQHTTSILLAGALYTFLGV